MNPLTPAPDTTTSHAAPMIDARQAAHTLGLPLYWFSERRMRTAKRIPHYLLGNLVRFRLTELEAWTLGFACRTRQEPGGPAHGIAAPHDDLEF